MWIFFIVLILGFCLAIYLQEKRDNEALYGAIGSSVAQEKTRELTPEEKAAWLAGLKEKKILNEKIKNDPDYKPIASKIRVLAKVPADRLDNEASELALSLGLSASALKKMVLENRSQLFHMNEVDLRLLHDKYALEVDGFVSPDDNSSVIVYDNRPSDIQYDTSYLNNLPKNSTSYVQEDDRDDFFSSPNNYYAILKNGEDVRSEDINHDDFVDFDHCHDGHNW